MQLFTFSMILLLQAHSYLSGLLLGMRLLCLLSRCHRGAGARTRHHVLAQWEVGLHRRALRLAALRPQEVCRQGDLRAPLSPTVASAMSHSKGFPPAGQPDTKRHCIRWCLNWTSWWWHTFWSGLRLVFSFVCFCVSGFHYVAAVFLQLCRGTAVVTKFGFTKRLSIEVSKAETTSAVFQTLFSHVLRRYTYISGLWKQNLSYVLY